MNVLLTREKAAWFFMAEFERPSLFAVLVFSLRAGLLDRLESIWCA